MPIKRYKPEQIVTMLRQIEVGIANGKTTPQACKGDHNPDVLPLAERMRRFEDGLGEAIEGPGKGERKLKRLVAELSLDKQILKDIAEGNF
jgi:putative transposase